MGGLKTAREPFNTVEFTKRFFKYHIYSYGVQQHQDLQNY